MNDLFKPVADSHHLVEGRLVCFDTRCQNYLAVYESLMFLLGAGHFLGYTLREAQGGWVPCEMGFFFSDH